MQKLNLPEYIFKIRQSANGNQIFDITRSKYIALTDEEWVRQNFIMYMIYDKGYSKSLISTEKSLSYGKLKKKADIVIYDNNAKPRIIVECKAPQIKLSQKTFEQIARYNFSLHVDYLIVTNGLQHYCCSIDYTDGVFSFLNDIPPASDI